MKDRIKQLRQSLGLTQAQMGARLGKSSGFISLLETGRRRVTEETVSAICNAFGVDLSINSEQDTTGQADISPLNDMEDQNPGALDTDDQNTDSDRKDVVGIGTRLKEVRLEYNLSREAFAKEIDAGSKYVRDIETGRLVPSHTFLEKVARRFSISLRWLRTGEGPKEMDYTVGDRLLAWINSHPEVIFELRKRSGR